MQYVKIPFCELWLGDFEEFIEKYSIIDFQMDERGNIKNFK